MFRFFAPSRLETRIRLALALGLPATLPLLAQTTENSPPEVGAIGVLSIRESEPYTFAVPVSDPDLPTQSLTFSLEGSPPAGVAIDSGTGVLSWQPTEEQGPASYSFTVRVTDNGSPALTTTEDLTVTVLEENQPPSIVQIDPIVALEGRPVFLGLEGVDPDLPANTLTYSLAPGTPGWVNLIDPSYGFMRLAIGEELGGTTNVIKVQVTDDGSPPQSGAIELQVVVREQNSPPTLAAVREYVVLENQQLEFVAGGDPDLPANNLRFEFVEGAPEGATLDPATGLFRWTPGPLDGPSVRTVTISVTDDGDPPAGDVGTFSITVVQPISGLRLDLVDDQSVMEGQTLDVGMIARDDDPLAPPLLFSLAPGAPPGSSIDPATGQFTWQTTEADGPGEYVITALVADATDPARTASTSFSVMVAEVNSPPAPNPTDSFAPVEGVEFALQLGGDSDLPANPLQFELLSPGPPGAVLDAATGMLRWIPSEDQGPGTFTVDFRITDEGTPPLSASGRLTLAVQEINRPPTLSGLKDLLVSPGEVISLIAGSDPDLPANRLTFTAGDGFPAGATLDPDTGLFLWATTLADAPSTNRITIRVVDDGQPALEAQQTFTVVLNFVNHPPILAAIAPQVLDEGQVLDLTVSAIDLDGSSHPVTLELGPDAPPGARLDPETGRLTWQTDENSGPGTYTMTVRAIDDGVPPLTAEQIVFVEVREINLPPLLSAPAAQSIDEGEPAFLAPIDPDIPASPLSFQITAPTRKIRLKWDVMIETNIVGYRLYSRPSPDAEWTLIAELPDRLTTQHEVPNLSGGQLHQFRLTAYGGDGLESAPSDIVSFGAPALDPDRGTVEWVPGELFGGSVQEFSVRLSDNASPALFDEKAFQVTIREVNQAPLLADLPVLSVIGVEVLEFPVMATDEDLPNDALRFSLEPDSPPWASIDPLTGLLRIVPDETLEGTRQIGVRVTDDGDPPLSDSILVTVHFSGINRPPIVSPIGPQMTTEGDSFALHVEAFDPDAPGQPLFYSLEPGAPAGMTVEAATGIIRWTPIEADGPAAYRITVLATENSMQLLTSAVTFELLVLERNEPPTLVQVLPIRIQEQNTWSLQLHGSDPDLPANRLRYSFDEAPPQGMSLDGASGLLRWTPSEADGPSSYSIRVRITDDADPPLDQVMSFSLSVQEQNRAPGIAPVDSQVATEGSLWSLQLWANDPDWPTNFLSFRLEQAPQGIELDPVTGVLSWTPSAEYTGLDSPVVVAVTDDGVPARTATTSFAIRVQPPPGLSLQLIRTTEGGTSLQIRGATGKSCRILRSMDLLNWSELHQTNAATDVVTIPLDIDQPDKGFYRLLAE